jgi:hypothetical protein
MISFLYLSESSKVPSHFLFQGVHFSGEGPDEGKTYLKTTANSEDRNPLIEYGRIYVRRDLIIYGISSYMEG